MKIKARKITIALALLLAFITCFCCLFGCKKAGPIPNGFYGCSNEGENVYKFTKSDIRDTCGWVISGDEIEYWVSSQCYYKAKIVERDEKIYFEGYKWFDFLYSFASCSKQIVGYETICEVTYNEIKKTFNVTILVEEG